MMTMTLDMTSQLAPILWCTVAALLGSAGVLVGLSLPGRREARFEAAKWLTIGCGLAGVMAFLIAA
jgi:hypothetical protein